MYHNVLQNRYIQAQLNIVFKTEMGNNGKIILFSDNNSTNRKYKMQQKQKDSFCIQQKSLLFSPFLLKIDNPQTTTNFKSLM